MNHKEITASIRKFIKQAGIKAKVQKDVSCGSMQVVVFVPSYDSEFTSSEIVKFCRFARDCGLTFVKGLEIVPSHEGLLTGQKQWNFVYTGER